MMCWRNLCRHGDMVFLYGTEASRPPGLEHNTTLPLHGGSAPASEPASASSSRHQNAPVVEDEVDKYLEKQDGRIQRYRNEQLYVQLCLCF